MMQHNHTNFSTPHFHLDHCFLKTDLIFSGGDKCGLQIVAQNCSSQGNHEQACFLNCPKLKDNDGFVNIYLALFLVCRKSQNLMKEFYIM